MEHVFLGTTNLTKAVHLSRLLKGLPCNIVSPNEWGLELAIPEQGVSHVENAVAKAVAWSEKTGTLTIASDGGLIIPALGAAWDSLQTHRFAGELNDAGKVKELLRMMNGLEGQERRVFWREAVALARAGLPLASWQVEGAEAMLAREVNLSHVVPGFWVAGLLCSPEPSKIYGDMESCYANDHWCQLRTRVYEFLERYLYS